MLAPYLNEAGWLLSDGSSIEEIDAALLDFGMPMGPLRLLDEVGLDVARHAGTSMAEAFGERLTAPPTILALEASKLLGKKGGRGFYRYDDEKPEVNNEIYQLLGAAVPQSRREISRADITDRAVFSMINEAARVLEDGIVATPGDVDIGMITGTGFPPFRGGLLRYADSMGMTAVLAKLQQLEKAHGIRFKPAPLIVKRAADGRGFYP